jgi:opacity protein-like surface antigen
MRRFVSFEPGPVLGLLATPIASAQQSVNFYVGALTLRGEDSRDRNDVLLNNLNFLAFNIKDFQRSDVRREWLIGFGNNFEGSLGVGFDTRTVPTVSSISSNTNGAEIEQDLKLRVVPFTATVRFLPLGRGNGIEPYIGAGVGVFNYRYSESGQFLATDQTIFRDTFIGSGTATGPVILGGVRVPVGSWALGGEIRYQSAKGDLPADQDFSGTKLDLGGFNYLFTVNVRF